MNWDEVLKKIELQSILVLFLTLLFGWLLLLKDNSFSTPAGWLGTISIGIGLLYTFGSFFSNQIRESYKDVIQEYKATIITLRTSQKHAKSMNEDGGTSTSKGNVRGRAIGEYETVSGSDMGTSDS